MNTTSEGVSPRDGTGAAATRVASIPVLAERLLVERHAEEVGALRVRIEVDEKPCDVSENAVVERVGIERVPRDLPVDSRRPPWTEGETLVVPLYEEVVVVERRLVLKEEVHLTRHAESLPLHGRTVLRSERAVIERRDGEGRWTAVDPMPASTSADTRSQDTPAGQPATPAP